MDTDILAATIIIALTFAISFGLAFLYVMGTVSSRDNPPNPEYDRFVAINAICPCTSENVSYCQGRSGCIHAYEYCQRRQCPQCFVKAPEEDGICGHPQLERREGFPYCSLINKNHKCPW